MTLTLQWRCKTPHNGCLAQDWQFYKQMKAEEAHAFMAEQAPNSRNFEYRIRP